MSRLILILTLPLLTLWESDAMALQTELYIWGDKTPSHPQLQNGRTICSPYLDQILAPYLVNTWGGQIVGCARHPGDPRYKVGSSSYSTHSHGAAIDWQWHENYGGPGSHRLDATVLPFLTRNSKELGINRIHDYRWGQKRIWERGNWRSANLSDTGTWIHIEVTPSNWRNMTSIPARLSQSGGKFEVVDVRLPTLEKGDKGNYVHKARIGLRRVIRDPKITRFGPFDAYMEKRVKDLQTWFKASERPDTVVDGVIGPQTWAIILEERWRKMK